MPLAWTDLLDPRPFKPGAPAIRDAVTIPSGEIHRRSHELPRPGARVRVAQIEGWEEAIAVLHELRRVPELCPDWGWRTEPQSLRLWSPNLWLEESAQGLEPGYALDLGCGSGREAVFLAAMGWEVVAVDRLPEALERGRGLQALYAPDSPLVSWVEADLRHGVMGIPLARNPELVYSLAYFEHRTLMSAWGCLAPGGVLLLECFTDEHLQRRGRPRAGRWTPLPAPADAGVWSVDLGWREDGSHTARLFARKART